MKAPETIFLHGYSFDDEPCKNWTLDPIKRGMRGYAIQNEKYIRKDALMEWAKEKKKQLLEQESANDEPSDVAAGINAGLDMLIGKLNSM